MQQTKGVIRAVKSDKSNPDAHVGNRAEWNTQTHGFGSTGFGRMGFGNPSWAHATTGPSVKHAHTIHALRPEINLTERNKVVKVKSFKDLKPFEPSVSTVRTELRKHDKGFEVTRHDGTKELEQEICLGGCITPEPTKDVERQKVFLDASIAVGKFLKKRIRKQAEPKRGEITDIRYKSKPAGIRGKRERLFTKSQDHKTVEVEKGKFEAKSPLPHSGGLSEADLVRMRERMVPRD